MKSKKVIFDTNLWVSFLITKDYSFLDKYVANGSVKLVFSKELIQEFLTVVKRPKLQRYFTDEDIQRLLHTFENYGTLVNVVTQVKLCRDSKDNFLLNLAIDSKAAYLATGDNDLLAIKTIGKTQILTIRELENKL